MSGAGRDEDPPAETPVEPRRDALWPFRAPPRGERVNEHVRDEPPPRGFGLAELARLVRARPRGPEREEP